MQNLTEQYRINPKNLKHRQEFILLGEQEIQTLRRLEKWADRVVDAIVQEFYDFQFSFPPTLAFFTQYAESKNIPVSEVRRRLEQSQRQYFLDIFQEAQREEGFGPSYFEKRLLIGERHNQIDLPLKWYMGSYSLYQRLISKHLWRAYFLQPWFLHRAEQAIFTVLNYDLQAVADAFFYSYLRSIGLDLNAIHVDSIEHDLSEQYATLKNTVLDTLVETAHTIRVLDETSDQVTAAIHQTTLAAEQISITVQETAEKAFHQTHAVEEVIQLLNEMRVHIDEVARGAHEQRNVVVQTADAMEQLAGAIADIRQGAREQTQGVEQALSARQGLTSSIQKVLGAAGEMTDKTQEVTNAAQEGFVVAQQTVDSIQKLRDTTDQLAERIRDLGERSGKIGVIVEAIDGIASQTNLLALNAAIEAARAGEHGKGFAVVADEVRKLAERTSKAAQEIAEMIYDVQQEADSAVQVMELAGADVSAAVELTNQAGDSFHTIVATTEASSEQVEKIRHALEQMQHAEQQVQEIISEISVVAQRNEEVAEMMGTINRTVRENWDHISLVAEQNAATADRMATSSTQTVHAMEGIADISNQNVVATQQIAASTEEVSAQMYEVKASVTPLSQIAQTLQRLIAQFELSIHTQRQAATTNGRVRRVRSRADKAVHTPSNKREASLIAN